MKPKNYVDIQRIFESFCKSVLKRTARDCYKIIKRRNDKEITFSAMSAQDLEKLADTDKYFAEDYVFNVHGASVILSDGELIKALNTIPIDKRDIVLMKYFFDMKDQNIADHLNMARRTVTYQRSQSLQELKKIMESEEWQ